MRTHTPAVSKTADGFKLNGKTLCGKAAGNVTSGKPTCGQCARNLRTPSGMARDGRGYLELRIERRVREEFSDFSVEIQADIEAIIQENIANGVAF